MAASLFGLGRTINVSANGTLVPESFVSTAGQTLFLLTAFQYVVGTNTLLIFLNGDKQRVGVDFYETSPTSFTFTQELLEGDIIEVIGFPEISLSASPASSVLIGSGYNLSTYLSDSPVNVKAYPYLARGDGSVDDTVAMQTAHNTGRIVYYPPGIYHFTNLTLSAGGGIRGAGQGQTILTSLDTSSSNAINYTALVNNPVFEDFSLYGPGALKLGGAGIAINPPSSEVHFASFRRVTFFSFPIGINFVKAAFWHVLSCAFIEYTLSGIEIQNTTNPDGGDHFIGDNCIFQTSLVGTAKGIIWNTSGGLKVIGCKFLNGQYAISIEGVGNAPTADFQIIGNSIEGQEYCGISFTRQSGTNTIQSVVISGNQFAGNLNDIQALGPSGFIRGLVISGNVSQMDTVGHFLTLDYITGFNISGNILTGIDGTATGIRIFSNCLKGKIGSNTYNGTFLSTLSNLSSSVVTDPDTQVGSVSGTTSIAYGSSGLFYIPLSVTFPIPYTVIPSIDVTVGSSGGAISSSVSGITLTDFNLNLYGIFNGETVTGHWTAKGII